MDSVVSSPTLVHEILEWGSRVGSKSLLIEFMFRGGFGPNECRRKLEHNRTLACCARVSRIWHDEACSILWLLQFGFTNMMRILELGSQGSASENRVALSRFLHYARFVKCAVSREEDFKDYHPFFIAQAQAQEAGLLMFPAMMMLDLRESKFLNRSVVNAASCLFGSSLQRLSLPSSSPMSSLILTNAIKFSGTQGLKKFCMRGDNSSDDDRAVFSSFVKAAPALKYVLIHVSWLNYEGMQALAHLRHLSDLELLDHRPTPPLSDPMNRPEVVSRFSQNDSTWFASLVDLKLRCYGSVTTSRMDTAFRHTRLQSFSTQLIMTLQDYNNAALPPFAPRSMNILDLVNVNVAFGGNLGVNTSADERIPRLDKHTLDCLSSCESLEYLSIWHARVPKLTDADLLALAQNWPGLKELRFYGVSVLERQDEPQNTVAILEHLPKLCPKLFQINIMCNGATAELRPAKNPQSLSPIDLINFQTSFIFDPPEPNRKESLMTIAAYLSTVLHPQCWLVYQRVHKISHPGISDSDWKELADKHVEIQQELVRDLEFAALIRSFGALP